MRRPAQRLHADVGSRVYVVRRAGQSQYERPRHEAPDGARRSGPFASYRSSQRHSRAQNGGREARSAAAALLATAPRSPSTDGPHVGSEPHAPVIEQRSLADDHRDWLECQHATGAHQRCQQRVAPLFDGHAAGA